LVFVPFFQTPSHKFDVNKCVQHHKIQIN
jgi:hypothetical protein